jgi:hypothetical protein
MRFYVGVGMLGVGAGLLIVVMELHGGGNHRLAMAFAVFAATLAMGSVALAMEAY